MAERGCWCEVAEAGSELLGQAGTVPARGAPHAAHVWMLFVREPWWGSGLATRLLERADAAAVAAGRTELRLQTPSEHARARALLRARGLSSAAGTRCTSRCSASSLVSYRRPRPAPLP
jgi:GNAT superfamily N-acetyltransferase